MGCIRRGIGWTGKDRECLKKYCVKEEEVLCKEFEVESVWRGTGLVE